MDQIIRKKSTAHAGSRAVNQDLEKENRQELRQLLEQQATAGLEVSKEEKLCKTQPRNVGDTTPSDDSETEKKYLELIDLLTVKMFENQPETNSGKTRPSKKSNSLPRTLDMSVQCGLQKSSSQNFPESPGLTAYERLFGKPRPGK